MGKPRTKTTDQRTPTTIRRLLMYKNFKPKRDRRGKIVKAAPFQKTLSSGEMSRVEPNRKWFGNTRVIGQAALQKFQEHLGIALKDPYQVIMKQTNLPITLLTEKCKNVRNHIVDTESFEYTFGPKAQRKKPNIKIPDLESLLSTAQNKSEKYSEETDGNLVTGNDRILNSANDSLFQKGQSKRIWGELYKVVDSSDVICEVLDSRDPMGTRCRTVEDFVRKEKPFKHIVLILNKVDLIPQSVTHRWIKILAKEYPTIAFHANMMNPFGKDSFLLIRCGFQLHKERQQISVGFIGYPNVGKICNVAPIPGETKRHKPVQYSGISEIDSDVKDQSVRRRCESEVWRKKVP
ncbi:unnamed protein product [Soboliphyme baturini]|uniref:Nucleolar GTP-binding protein 2 n=1 Tax=Soboliphyme baturini TaxID=241478 RepID=A0A183IIV9_9BILA|nr:unnamed protein product [Soboliphyme baturini]